MLDPRLVMESKVPFFPPRNEALLREYEARHHPLIRPYGSYGIFGGDTFRFRMDLAEPYHNFGASHGSRPH